MNLHAFIFDAIPMSFWVGCAVGGVAVGIFGAALLWCLNFVLRHWKAVLLLCAVVLTVSGVLAL